MNEYVRTYTGNADFSITIQPNPQQHILDISDFSQYRKRKVVFEEDRTTRTFLEMAITQFSINKWVLQFHLFFILPTFSNVYSPVGAGKLFEVTPENQRRVGNGVVLRSGVAKGVRVVQNYGKPSPALVLDGNFQPYNE